jgi:hypothetical protein
LRLIATLQRSSKYASAHRYLARLTSESSNQPEIKFFNNRLGDQLERRYQTVLLGYCEHGSSKVCTSSFDSKLKHSQSFAREISPTGEGVNPRKKGLGMKPAAIVTVRTELHSVSISGDRSPAKKFLLNGRRYLQWLFEAKTQLQRRIPMVVRPPTDNG